MPVSGAVRSSLPGCWENGEAMSDIPLWLRIRERIDFYLFVAERLSAAAPRTALDREIDRVTGAGAARERQAGRLVRHLARLKRLYSHHAGMGEEVSDG